MAYAIGVVTFGSVVLVWRTLLERQPQAARARAVARRRPELQAELAGAGRRRRRTQLPDGPDRSPPAPGGCFKPRRRRRSGTSCRAPAFGPARPWVRTGGEAGLPADLRLRRVPVGLRASGRRHPGALPARRSHRRRAARLLPPDVTLPNAATKRRQALQKSLPEGLDLLVICAEAGLTWTLRCTESPKRWPSPRPNWPTSWP